MIEKEQPCTWLSFEVTTKTWLSHIRRNIQNDNNFNCRKLIGEGQVVWKTFRKILSKTCLGCPCGSTVIERRLADWQRGKSKASMFFKKAFSSKSSVEVNFLGDGGGRRRPLAWLLMAKNWKAHNSRPKIVCLLDFAAFFTILTVYIITV